MPPRDYCLSIIPEYVIENPYLIPYPNPIPNMIEHPNPVSSVINTQLQEENRRLRENSRRLESIIYLMAGGFAVGAATLFIMGKPSKITIL